MVQLLVRLITCAGDERQLQEVDEEEEEEEEELLRPRDQDLASACMFTRREQAAMAAEVRPCSPAASIQCHTRFAAALL